MKETDLHLFIQLTKRRAIKFSNKWWDIIADDDVIEPYCDYDQEELDGIFADYDRAINLLKDENSKLRKEAEE